MLEIFGTHGCCGADEIVGIWDYDPADVVRAVLQRRADNFVNIPLYVFSGTGEGYCEELAKFIKKNKLGSVVKSREKVNPNTGNHIRIWVWAASELGLKSYAQRNKLEYYEPPEEEAESYDW